MDSSDPQSPDEAATDPGPPPDPHPPADPAPADSEPERHRAFDLLLKVKTGEVSGKLLRPEERQALVAIMTAEGASAPEIAHHLKVSDRTVERDRLAIAKRNALVKDPALTGIVLGHYRSVMDQSIQNMRRIARDKEVDPAVRVEANFRCAQVADMFVERLQSAGLVDRAPQQVQAAFTHQALVPTAESLADELERLKAIDPASPAIPSLEGLVARATAATTFKELTLTPDGTEVLHEDRP